MKTSVTAALRSLVLLGSHAIPAVLRQADETQAPDTGPMLWAETRPMVFRSEGFAEDLLDAYPVRLEPVRPRAATPSMPFRWGRTVTEA